MWNAQSRFKRDASSDKKREGGEGKICVRLPPPSCTTSNLYSTAPPTRTSCISTSTHLHVGGTPITTMVRDEMEGKGREEMKGEHVWWVHAAVGMVLQPPGVPEYNLSTALKCICVRPHALCLHIQSSPMPFGFLLVPHRFDMDIGIELRVRPTHHLRPQQLKEKITGRREGSKRMHVPCVTRRAAPTPTPTPTLPLPLISNLPPPIPAPYTSLDTFTFICLPPSILSPPTCTQPHPPSSFSSLIPSPSTRSVGASMCSCLPGRRPPHGSRCLHGLLPVNISECACVEAKRVEGSRYSIGFEGEGIAGRIWIESAGWGLGGVWEDELVEGIKSAEGEMGWSHGGKHAGGDQEKWARMDRVQWRQWRRGMEDKSITSQVESK
ncbi:hypothetical protein DFH08DRAFT_801753 [Mycena albidolilacea]|uniref:Uncharacterized protein n=1 Tax=Mycena albidolilacea TaxID=1033008 RepID=A0AAD7AFX0_9AGAR|nr:hypothetical protein DFH08DRAFT_801753 [Mycena albidolilacea]